MILKRRALILKAESAHVALSAALPDLTGFVHCYCAAPFLYVRLLDSEEWTKNGWCGFGAYHQNGELWYCAESAAILRGWAVEDSVSLGILH